MDGWNHSRMFNNIKVFFGLRTLQSIRIYFYLLLRQLWLWLNCFLSLKSTTRLWINFNLCNYCFCIAHLYIYPTCRLFLRTVRFHWSRKVYLYFNHCIIAEKKEREKNSTWNDLFFLSEESRLLSGGNSHQIWSVTSQHVVRLASDSRQHYFP